MTSTSQALGCLQPAGVNGGSRSPEAHSAGEVACLLQRPRSFATGPPAIGRTEAAFTSRKQGSRSRCTQVPTCLIPCRPGPQTQHHSYSVTQAWGQQALAKAPRSLWCEAPSPKPNCERLLRPGPFAPPLAPGLGSFPPSKLSGINRSCPRRGNSRVKPDRCEA